MQTDTHGTIAFMLALLTEDETVKAIGEIHASLVDKYLGTDSAEGANLRARQLLEAALTEREVLHGSNPSRAVH